MQVVGAVTSVITEGSGQGGQRMTGAPTLIYCRGDLLLHCSPGPSMLLLIYFCSTSAPLLLYY
jgi:hypothetical protein